MRRNPWFCPWGAAERSVCTTTRHNFVPEISDTIVLKDTLKTHQVVVEAGCDWHAFITGIGEQ
jgi:hypothetical protein